MPIFVAVEQAFKTLAASPHFLHQPWFGEIVISRSLDLMVLAEKLADRIEPLPSELV
jgi:hypothetical protein